MELKMTTSEKIRLYLAAAPAFLIGIVQGLKMLIKFYIKSLQIMYKAWKSGETVCYTGIKESWWKFTKDLLWKRQHVILHSNEGNLLCCHGNPSQKLPFNLGGINSTEFELTNKVESGDYILVSCHNYWHSDINLNGVKAVREPSTITKYPILFLYIPILNKVWLTSSKEVGEFYSEMGMDMELMEKGYDETIWKNVERSVRILSEDELPEEIKRKLS